MAISPLDVKKLRDKTGAGFGDCKEALEKSAGNFEAAEKYLKEKGLASVAKRAGREANEGRIFSFVDGNKAGLMEISCETDFVARNDEFVASGKSILSEMVKAGAAVKTDVYEQQVKELAIKVKENLAIKNYKLLTAAAGEVLVDYIHGEGRVGVVVKVKVADAGKAGDAKVKELAFDLALHAAAFAPAYLNRTQVDQNWLKEQEEIMRTRDADQLKGKPDNVVAGIMKGKVEKFLKQISFVDQPFVKDDKISVAQAAENVGKALGTKVELVDFAYFRIGQES